MSVPQIDPVTEKHRVDAERKAASENSFEAIAREWHEVKKGEWSKNHAVRVLVSAFVLVIR